MPELNDPVAGAVRRTLRRAVLDHAGSERRRHHRSLVHVGVPGTGELVVPVHDDEPTDHSLRTDVLAATFARATRSDADGVLVWLTRTGPLELQDVDAAWLSAARAAAAEADLDLTLVVVNRHGWRDPRSGATTTWKRLRQR